MINIYVKADYSHRGHFLDDSYGVRDWYDEYKVSYTLYCSVSILPLSPLQLLYLDSLLSDDRDCIFWHQESVEEAEDKASNRKTKSIVSNINKYIEDNIFKSGRTAYDLTDYLKNNKKMIDTLICKPTNKEIEELRQKMSEYGKSLHFYERVKEYDSLRDEYSYSYLSKEEEDHNHQMQAKYNEFCAPLNKKIQEIENELCPFSPGRILWNNHLWNINEKWNNQYPLEYAYHQKDFEFFHEIVLNGGTRLSMNEYGNIIDYKSILLFAMKSNPYSLSDYYKLKKVHIDKIFGLDRSNLIAAEYCRAIELRNPALIYKIFETNKNLLLQIMSNSDVSIYTLQKNDDYKPIIDDRRFKFVMNEYIQPIVNGTFKTNGHIDLNISDLEREEIYHFC